MEKSIKELQNCLDTVQAYFNSTGENDLLAKPNPNKWSKKEILGHLIDSGVNNLQRFTEIQFKDKPYHYSEYQQNDLVLANQYQKEETKELLAFWVSLNKRIISIMKNQTEETLSYEIVKENKHFNLEFLMKDYVEHMKHHINQIIT